MNHEIGRLRAGLRNTGSHENTLLWYCGDSDGLMSESSGDAEKKAVFTKKTGTHPKTCFMAKSSEKFMVEAGGGKGSEACWSTSRTFFANNADPWTLQPIVAERGFGMGSGYVAEFRTQQPEWERLPIA